MENDMLTAEISPYAVIDPAYLKQIYEKSHLTLTLIADEMNRMAVNTRKMDFTLLSKLLNEKIEPPMTREEQARFLIAIGVAKTMRELSATQEAS